MGRLATVTRAARRAAVTPQLVHFVLSSRRRADPYRAYRRLRKVDPLHRSPIGIWVLSRHADVMAALRHPAMGSDESKADPEAINLGVFRLFHRGDDRTRHEGPFIDVLRRLMLFLDPPDHTRLRSLVNKAFTPKRVAAVEPRILELVDEMLDELERRGHAELMSEFAYPLPARVICELLGVPADGQDVIVRNAPALATGLDPNPMRTPESIAAADAAVMALRQYLDGLIEERRREPGADLLSALIEAEDGGDRLDHEELVATLILLLIAGHETTANLIGNGLLALTRHPGELERFRRSAEGDREAIEELLRYDGPIQMTQRITLDDVEIDGERIPAGRIVVLCVGSANRDPAVFPDPDRLDLQRQPTQHVAFGGGSHFCVGAPLARVEARIALRTLVDRLGEFDVTAPRPAWRPSFTVRGLRHLHLTWRT